MTAQSGWAPAGPARFGLPGFSGAPAVAGTGLESVPTPSAGAAAELDAWSPSNPMLILGVLVAVTFGLMAVSTTVRVGPVKASASAGK